MVLYDHHFLAHLSRLFPQKVKYFLWDICRRDWSDLAASRLYLEVLLNTDIFAGYSVRFLWLMMNIAFFNWQTPIKSIRH
jgi:hypothetical protein